MKKIILKWEGPIDFDRIKNKEYTDQFTQLSKGGIYLHCFKIPNQQIFAINYVGKHEYSILSRNIEHYNKSKMGKNSIFCLKEDSFLNIIYNQNDFKNFENYKNDISENDINLKLFYVNKVAKDIYEFETLLPLEGALLYHLYSKTKTRKYLTTNVSNYDLRNTKIYNVKSKINSKNKILGLDDEIITYVD